MTAYYKEASTFRLTGIFGILPGLTSAGLRMKGKTKQSHTDILFWSSKGVILFEHDQLHVKAILLFSLSAEQSLYLVHQP